MNYDTVKKLFDYHEDGYLIWKVDRGCSKRGRIAGFLNKDSGYLYVGYNHKNYSIHRLIFLWHHGYLPELVDHKDRIVHHNWIDNLREASKQCNSRNSKIKNTNTSGVTGVHQKSTSSNWVAKITISGKAIQIGTFKNFDDAVMARWRKEVELNWNGCNSTSASYLYLKEKEIIPKNKRVLRIHKGA